MAMYGNADTIRLDGRPGHNDQEHITDFRKDYARLIHCPSFRRLQNKTQLFPGLESDFFRNRLTHSLEVAQIAGGIAHTLNATEPKLRGARNAIDVDLVQFAAAAHDLGHSPFGHNGESALDDAMKKFGGFEGNAQTLRVLSRLEKKVRFISHEFADFHGRLGLNLTRRALASVLKYDVEIPAVRGADEELVKGYYKSEANVVACIKRAVAPRSPSTQQFKTIECQIMDVADDIAYSTYDLEDTLKGGFLSPTQMIREVETSSSLVNDIDTKVRKALAAEGNANPAHVTADEINEFLVSTFFPEMNSTEKSSTYFDYFSMNRSYVEDGYVRTSLTSWLVGSWMESLTFEFNSACPALSSLKLQPKVRRVIEILKHLNYHLTIRSPRLSVVQFRGYDLVRRIFDALTTDKGRDLLPMDVRILHDACTSLHEQRRVVCDFIAGMTDRYAVEFYSRLYNGDQSIFKPF
jgi:dGTPase